MFVQHAVYIHIYNLHAWRSTQGCTDKTSSRTRLICPPFLQPKTNNYPEIQRSECGQETIFWPRFFGKLRWICFLFSDHQSGISTASPRRILLITILLTPLLLFIVSINIATIIIMFLLSNYHQLHQHHHHHPYHHDRRHQYKHWAVRR